MLSEILLIISRRRRRRLAGHLFQDRWKDQAEGLSFYHPGH